MVKLLSAKVCTIVALGIVLLVSTIVHPPNLEILARDAYRHACNMLASAACRQSQNAPPQDQREAELE
jgi:uncharacterized membrane protein YccC